jgi:Electron transfer DM13
MTRTRPTRWLAAPTTAAIFVAGVWVTGGLLTNSFKAAMALTALWFVASGVACAAIGLRRRSLRMPVIGGYLVAAAAVGGYLAWTTLRDTVVHEHVVVGTPASQAEDSSPSRNVELVSGSFSSVEHESRGAAAVVRVRGGERMLTLTHFSTSPGPDLRVRLVVGRTENGGSSGARDLGALKGNKGDQQYRVPDEIDLARYRAVVIWCRAFSVAFAKANLDPA